MVRYTCPRFHGALTVARRFLALRLAASLTVIAALAACSVGDARLDKLTVGIASDSVMKLMGVEKPLRTDPFLIKGQYIEAMYYQKVGGKDTADRKLSPVVVINGKLAGWGWSYLDSLATATGIVVAKK